MNNTTVINASEAVPSPEVESHPMAFPLNRREFHFVTDSDQIRNHDAVILTVTGAANRAEAKQLIREFLEDVERNGLRIS